MFLRNLRLRRMWACPFLLALPLLLAACVSLNPPAIPLASPPIASPAGSPISTSPPILPPTLVLASTPPQTPTATFVPPSPHRIGIRTVKGAAEFFDRVTGNKFVPRGAAVWRWKYWPPGQQQTVIDTIFNTQIGQLDSALAELPKMREDGFNVVRLWFNACWGGAPGCLDRPGGEIDRAFLQNMARFLRVAQENGIYAILTMDDLPDNYQYLIGTDRNKYQGFNAEFLTQGGINAQSKYQTDLIRGLMEVGAPMDAILAYQLKEEAYFEEDKLPFAAKSGTVTPANGKTYDLADPKQRRALMEDSWLYYIEQVSQAIKAVDPTALVTMGFFVQQEPNRARVGDPRIVYLHKVLNESVLDFVSFSAYPGYELNMRQTAENFDIIGYDKKPLVMGEFGADRKAYPDVRTAAMILQTWQVESCKFGFDGWQVWTWGGGDVHLDFWEAIEGDGAIRRALSPTRNPDPCVPGEEMKNNPNLAYHKPVTASRFLPDQPPQQAVDGNPWQWGSGDGPPQWIQIDLLKPATIKLIRLTVAQYPDGPTVHRVWGGSAEGEFTLLHEFKGLTKDNEILEFAPPRPLTNIRYIKVETVASPSWVSWKEIEIIAP